MITKLGSGLIESDSQQVSSSFPLGASLAGGVLGTVGAKAVHKILRGPLIRAALKPGPHFTDNEGARIINNMLGTRKDIKIDYEAAKNLPSHFSPMKKTVVAPKQSYLLAHELGHATGLFGKNRILGQLGAIATYGIGGPVLAPIITGMGSAHKAYNRELGLSEENDSRTLNTLTAISQAGTAGQLAEEAQASIRGINAIGKIQGRAGMLRAAKVFGPAFGTYALAAAGSHAIAPWLGGLIGRRMGKSRLKAETAEKDK